MPRGPGLEYRTLVAKTREIAGGIIRRSRNGEPITDDSEMHSPEIAAELKVLAPFEDGYMNAVADKLGARSPPLMIDSRIDTDGQVGAPQSTAQTQGAPAHRSVRVARARGGTTQAVASPRRATNPPPNAW